MNVKEFINGFRKIDYTVDLPMEFNEMKIKLGKNIINSMKYIAEEVQSYPINNVRYGIRDFYCEKADPSFISQIKELKRPIYLVKHICKEVKSVDLIENNAINTVISLGLDGNAWKITVKSFFVSNCFTHEFDCDFTDFCINITDAFLKDININTMLDKNYFVDLSNYHLRTKDIISRKYFTGYIRTCGDQDDFTHTHINDILDTNSYESFKDSIVEESSTSETDFNSFITDNSLVVDVIRKTPIRIPDFLNK